MEPDEAVERAQAAAEQNSISAKEMHRDQAVKLSNGFSLALIRKFAAVRKMYPQHMKI
jgi:hypothetical protein